MTCIVGIADKGHVTIGGDSAGVGGYDLRVRKDPKVFRNGPFLMGYTSSFRMGQLLRFAFTPPEHPKDMDIDRYMMTVWIDAVRECFKAGGYAAKNSDRESGGVFLVGYQGRLFRIDDDFQVGETVDGYDACGCGDSFALGAMHATQGYPPLQRVRIALEAAERWSAGVRGPFTIDTQE